MFGLLDALLCPSESTEALECRGAAIYSLSPVSGAVGGAFLYAGHAIITGLVAGAIGVGIAVHRRSAQLYGRPRPVARLVAVALPVWVRWAAVVDHMGRNASEYELWSLANDQAPSWPVGATALVTGYGHGRGAALLVLLAVAWVMDVRTLWAGGYTLMIEGDDGGGRWGPWRWRAWQRPPRGARLRLPGVSRWARVQADLVDLVVTACIEARWARLTFVEAALARQPGLLARAPANLRVVREDAARTELDPPPQRWWPIRLAAPAATPAGVGVIALAPSAAHDLAVSLGEEGAWLAGILDALGTLWDSLSWQEKAGLIALAGAIVILSGGTLGWAFQAGMGVATVMGSMHGAADAAMALLTALGGGALGYAGGQFARSAYYAYREARYATWPWRTDRAVAAYGGRGGTTVARSRPSTPPEADTPIHWHFAEKEAYDAMLERQNKGIFLPRSSCSTRHRTSDYPTINERNTTMKWDLGFRWPQRGDVAYEGRRYGPGSRPSNPFTPPRPCGGPQPRPRRRPTAHRPSPRTSSSTASAPPSRNPPSPASAAPPPSAVPTAGEARLTSASTAPSPATPDSIS